MGKKEQKGGKREGYDGVKGIGKVEESSDKG
jgi:hypothetical protein